MVRELLTLKECVVWSTDTVEEKWLIQSEKTNIAKMIEVLHKIGAFFDSSCKWILSDVCILVCHYQGKLMDDFLSCPELPADHDA